MNKKALRREALARRRALGSERVEWDKLISERLLSLDSVARARSVMTYISCQGEVGTHDLIHRWLDGGLEVYVPRISPPDPRMEPVRIRDFEKDLRPGFYGILEPDGEAPVLDDPKSIDLHIIPGVLITETGDRLGQGGGYYDRFLKRVSPDAALLALAYEWQITDALPREPWDIPVPMIVTEQRLIVCGE